MLSAISKLAQNKIMASDSHREDTFYCPSCQEELILCKGQIKIPYFRHQKESNCYYSTNESQLHYETKLQLYEHVNYFFQKNLKEISIEKYLGDVRPDIYFETKKNNKIAIEVQASILDIREIERRTMSYFDKNITVLWVIPFFKDLFYSLDGNICNVSDLYSIKFKSFIEYLYYLYFKKIFFWDTDNLISYGNQFISLCLDKIYTDYEFYTQDGEYMSGERLLKKTRRISDYSTDLYICDFRIKYYNSFSIGDKYTLPERKILDI